jgi:hypothetical protein
MKIITSFSHCCKAIVLAVPFLLLFSCVKDFDLQEFKSPSSEYRSVPFWSLNDSLDSGEIRRQLGLMKQAGQGGAFLHSRVGLLTPYLGDEWFDIMETGVKTCDSLGLQAWFYDEDKWPSGFAGGIVPLADQKFRSRQLARIPADAFVDPEDSVLFRDERHQYICHVAKLGMSAYNGTCWVDLMNPDMVDFFIDCSYSPYIRKFKGKRSVRGIFTDEPQVKATRVPCKGADAQIPYSPYMEAKFKNLWGYDLDPVLPSLVDTAEGWRVHRLHYHRTVAACLEEAFSAKIGNYCDAHGFVWTGHYNGEDTPSTNVVHEGNLMQQLRHMSQPGCDALGLQLQTFHNAKVTTSVANQYGKDRRLVEIFGISGHNLSFEDRMWIAGWHTICGLNFMCPHLALYSMKGERKRDYPPTLSFHQPYWKDNKLFEDYSARLCYFASSGKTVGEVCVVSPLESDFIEHSFMKKADSDDNDNSRWDRSFENTMRAVAESNLNFDIADEQIMSEDGSVSASGFRIREMTYSTVIVPPMLTIRPSTIDLLTRFASQGGKVVVVDSYPELVEGVQNDALLEGLRRVSVLVDMKGLHKALEDVRGRKFTVRMDSSEIVYTHLRSLSKGYMVQIFNPSRESSAILAFKPLVNGKVTVLDPASGDALNLVEGTEGFEIALQPAASLVLMFGIEGRGPRTDGIYNIKGKGEKIVAIEGEWSGRRCEANSLPLDFADFSFDGGATWTGVEPVLAFYKRSEKKGRYDGPLKLRYEFNVRDIPEACSLAVEQPHMYDLITVNGSVLSFNGEGWFKDPCIRMADISGLLHEGINRVEMSLDYSSPVAAARDARERYGSEIETIYVVGNFAVDMEMAENQPTTTWRNQMAGLDPKPVPIRFKQGSARLVLESPGINGNITLKGYPFYAGSFELENIFKMDSVDSTSEYFIDFSGVEAIVLKVGLNGVDIPPIFSSPWEADVTGLLKEGHNEIKVTLTGSLRNLMGPYHHAGGELARVGPGSFTGEDDWLCLTPGNDDWYDMRRTGSTLLWRDDYYCIPFGLLRNPEIIRR